VLEELDEGWLEVVEPVVVVDGLPDAPVEVEVIVVEAD
jgi:hypothetical protein